MVRYVGGRPGVSLPCLPDAVCVMTAAHGEGRVLFVGDRRSGG